MSQMYIYPVHRESQLIYMSIGKDGQENAKKEWIHFITLQCISCDRIFIQLCAQISMKNTRENKFE